MTLGDADSDCVEALYIKVVSRQTVRFIHAESRWLRA